MRNESKCIPRFIYQGIIYLTKYTRGSFAFGQDIPTQHSGTRPGSDIDCGTHDDAIKIHCSIYLPYNTILM